MSSQRQSDPEVEVKTELFTNATIEGVEGKGTPVRIVLVSAGTSEHSSTTRLVSQIGEAVRQSLLGLGQTVQVDFVGLRDLASALGSFDATGSVTAELGQALSKVSEADGLVVGTPVYKASMSGLFKSFWDAASDDSVVGIPIVLAATAGTPRHSLVTDTDVRGLFAYLRGLPVPTSVFAATEDFAQPGSLNSRVARAAAELTVMIRAGIKRALKEVSLEHRLRTGGRGQNLETGTDHIDFDTELMRLATGGV